MKIWITRQSASCILVGGLERLDVWFEKPVYQEIKYWSSPKDTPFYTETPEGIYSGDRWEIVKNGKCERKSFSFGSVFGYTNNKDPDSNEIAAFVWEKLKAHFGNEDFGNAWEIREKEGISNKRDFLLEIDLTVQLKK